MDLERELQRFISEHKDRIGLVSMDAPLISNLSIWSNIALIRQYHQNMPLNEAKNIALELLSRMEMEGVLGKRNSALDPEERFCIMLLRAAMVRDAILVLDRPFSILINQRDGAFVMDALKKIDDLIAETYIFDYSWAESCYEANNDQ